MGGVRTLLDLQKLRYISCGRRAQILRWLGMRVGEETRVMNGCDFQGTRLSIGHRVLINIGTLIDAEHADVMIESHVSISFGVKIVTASHEIGSPQKRAGPNTSSSITIGEGSWVGAGAIILPGVRIGKGSVIAAGAVVTRTTHDHALYAGLPARFVRPLDIEAANERSAEI